MPSLPEIYEPRASTHRWTIITGDLAGAAGKIIDHRRDIGGVRWYTIRLDDGRLVEFLARDLMPIPFGD